jgi:hypothetical protein
MTGAISGVADFGGIALVAVGDRDAFVAVAAADGFGVGEALSLAAESAAGTRNPAASAVTAAAATAGREATMRNPRNLLNPVDPLNLLNALLIRWCL